MKNIRLSRIALVDVGYGRDRMSTDTSEKGPETLIVRHRPVNDGRAVYARRECRVLDGYLTARLVGGRQSACRLCSYKHLARVSLLDGHSIGGRPTARHRRGR